MACEIACVHRAELALVHVFTDLPSRVVRIAPCPVLTVKPPAARERARVAA
jgi:nucleotide-binding universal stress UspA family protein